MHKWMNNIKPYCNLPISNKLKYYFDVELSHSMSIVS